MYCLGMVHLWIIYKPLHLRKIQPVFWMWMDCGASYTSSLVATTTLWSHCYFFWISSININLQIPFVWSQTVRGCIISVLCCCQCACHSCWWGLAKVSWFSSISDLVLYLLNTACIALKSLTRGIYPSAFVWGRYSATCECWCTSGLLIPCVWWP